MMSREEWLKEEVYGKLWWCGDEDCDCHQPEIVKVGPDHQRGYPRREVIILWQGTFMSEPTAEDFNQWLYGRA
jgi:hypothetical protein